MIEGFSYEDLAEFIVYYLLDNFHHPETKIDGTVVWNVDNTCTSSLQIATGVLNRLQVLSPIDELGRRNVFNCEPHEIKDIIKKNEKIGCSYETLVMAITCLLVQRHGDPRIGDYLVQMGLCTRAKDSNRPIGRFRWTKRSEQYLALYEDWPNALKS